MARKSPVMYCPACRRLMSDHRSETVQIAASHFTLVACDRLPAETMMLYQQQTQWAGVLVRNVT